MSTPTVTFEQLHDLLLSEFPDIPSRVLRVNAEIISAHKPELASLLGRIITASPERDGRSHAVNFVRNMLTTTGTAFHADDHNALTDSELASNVSKDWRPDRVTDIVKLWNARNLAQALNVDYYTVYPDKDTVEWFHDHFLKGHLRPEDLYDDGHWNGIILLYLFSQNRDNYSRLTRETVRDFIQWVRHHDDFAEAARLCVERKTVDVAQLNSLSETFRGLSAPVRAGAL